MKNFKQFNSLIENSEQQDTQNIIDAWNKGFEEDKRKLFYHKLLPDHIKTNVDNQAKYGTDELTKHALTQYSTISPHTLYNLAISIVRPHEIKTLAAKHDNLSGDYLDNLFKNEYNYGIFKAALDNPNINENHVEAAFKNVDKIDRYGTHYIKQKAFSHKKAPIHFKKDPNLTALYSDNINHINDAFKSNAITGNTIDRIINTQFGRQQSNTYVYPSEQVNCAVRHKNINPDTLNRIFNYGNNDLMHGALDNPNVTTDHIKLAIKHGDKDTVKKAKAKLGSPRFSFF